MKLNKKEFKYIMSECTKKIISERYDLATKEKDNPYYNGNDFAFGNDQYYELEKAVPKICKEIGWDFTPLVGPSGNPGAPFEITHGFLVRPNYSSDMPSKKDAIEFLKYQLSNFNNYYIGKFNAGFTADLKKGDFWHLRKGDIYISIADNKKAQDFDRLSKDYKERNKNIY